ncbi:hypothetical protein V3C99_015805 [Haemonchus contortus]
MLRGNKMLGISLSTRRPKGNGSSELGYELSSGTSLYMSRNRRPGRLLTGSPGTSTEHQDGCYRDGQTSPRTL